MSRPAPSRAARLRKALWYHLRVGAEWARGLDVTRVGHPADDGFDPKTVYRSMSSGNRYLHRALCRLDVGPEDRVLDVGCGKGGAMRVMQRFPFGAVHGLEISERLAAVAERNLRRRPDPRCRVLRGDAATFDGYGRYNMIYLFNPFPCGVAEGVFRRIAEAAARRPDEVLVLYSNPRCHALLAGSGPFTKALELPASERTSVFVYSSRRPPRSRLAWA